MDALSFSFLSVLGSLCCDVILLFPLYLQVRKEHFAVHAFRDPRRGRIGRSSRRRHDYVEPPDSLDSQGTESWGNDDYYDDGGPMSSMVSEEGEGWGKDDNSGDGEQGHWGPLAWYRTDNGNDTEEEKAQEVLDLKPSEEQVDEMYDALGGGGGQDASGDNVSSTGGDVGSDVNGQRFDNGNGDGGSDGIAHDGGGDGDGNNGYGDRDASAAAVSALVAAACARAASIEEVMRGDTTTNDSNGANDSKALVLSSPRCPSPLRSPTRKSTTAAAVASLSPAGRKNNREPGDLHLHPRSRTNPRSNGASVMVTTTVQERRSVVRGSVSKQSQRQQRLQQVQGRHHHHKERYMYQANLAVTSAGLCAELDATMAGLHARLTIPVSVA